MAKLLKTENTVRFHHFVAEDALSALKFLHGGVVALQRFDEHAVLNRFLKDALDAESWSLTSRVRLRICLTYTLLTSTKTGIMNVMTRARRQSRAQR